MRLDDAHDRMALEKWNRLYSLLVNYDIKPIVAVIPQNEDLTISFNQIIPNFWEIVRKWETSGWNIALHGYKHLYYSQNGGINPVHYRSEFAGLSLEKQMDSIKRAYDIFLHNSINPSCFVAPSHTFDLNTIEALKRVTPIEVISDTFAFNIFKRYGIFFMPQQVGRPRNIVMPGVWTFCLHPSNMTEHDFEYLERFIDKFSHRFVRFEDLTFLERRISLLEIFIQKLYYFYRRLKK